MWHAQNGRGLNFCDAQRFEAFATPFLRQGRATQNGT